MLRVNSDSAKRIAVIIIAARTFIALTVDGHEYMNTGWLCAIIGALITLIYYLIFRNGLMSNRITDTGYGQVYFSVLGLYMSYQTAVMIRLIVNTVSYSNLQIIKPIYLTLILYAACFYITIKNGQGIGNALKIWFIASGVIIAIIIVSSLGDMRPKWITPVLGPGAKTVVKGSIEAAGYMTAGMLVAAHSNEYKKYTCKKAILYGTVCIVSACLYWSLMSPVQLKNHMDRLTGIELLLSNGRTSLAVLLPMTIIWFMGIFAATAGTGFAAAYYVQKSITHISKKTAAIAFVSFSMLFALSGLAESNKADLVSIFTFPALILLTAISSVICYVKGRSANAYK